MWSTGSENGISLLHSLPLLYFVYLLSCYLRVGTANVHAPYTSSHPGVAPIDMCLSLIFCCNVYKIFKKNEWFYWNWPKCRENKELVTTYSLFACTRKFIPIVMNLISYTGTEFLMNTFARQNFRFQISKFQTVLKMGEVWRQKKLYSVMTMPFFFSEPKSFLNV